MRLTPAMKRALELFKRREAGEQVNMSSVKVATSEALLRHGLTIPHPKFPHMDILKPVPCCTLGAIVMVGNDDLNVERCDSCQVMNDDTDAAMLVATVMDIASKFTAKRPQETLAQTLRALETALGVHNG